MTWGISNLSADIGTALIQVNSQMGQYIGSMILAVIFISSLILTHDKKPATAMMVASFMTFMASLFLVAMSMIHQDWILAPVILLGLSIFFGVRQGNTVET